MKKIEKLLKQDDLTIGEINLLKRINSLATEIEKNLASTGEKLSKLQKEYTSLRPVSTVLMMDPVTKEKYDKIQEVDTTSYYHGFQHIRNVVKNIKIYRCT